MPIDRVVPARYMSTFAPLESKFDYSGNAQSTITVDTPDDKFESKSRKSKDSFLECIENSIIDTVTGGHPEQIETVTACNWNESVIGPQAIWGIIKGCYNYFK